MRRAARRSLAALVLVCTAAAARAEAADFTVYAGHVKPGSLTIANIRHSLDGGPIYGFRLSHGFLPFLGLEHTLGFSSGFGRLSDAVRSTDVKGFVYNSNLIVNAPVGRTVPYATAGVGILRQYGADETLGTKFAVNYGGGVKFKRLLGPLGLRLDARGYTASGITSGRLNVFEVTAGILIGF